jgi:predicted deacylase
VTRTRLLVVAAVASAVVALLPGTAQGATGPVAATPTAPSPRTADSVARAWRAAAPATVVVGSSVRGRAIVAIRQGRADAPYVLLVLGQMHGSEPRGRAVVAAVRTLAPPAQVQVWTISTMNPDGAAAGSRTNARGTDLNRNFPRGWVHRWTRPWYYPGRAPASEPETRAMMVFLDHLRPGLVVSLHQAFNSIDVGSGKTVVWAARLAAALRLPQRSVPCGTGPCTGTLGQWFNAGHPGVSVTVELPRTVSSAQALAYARGILRVGARLAG